MSHSRLDDVGARALLLESLWKMKAGKITTPSNNLQLSNDMPVLQMFDVTSGGNKNVLLPAFDITNRDALWLIGNAGSSNNVVVKDTTGVTTVATLTPGQLAFISSNGVDTFTSFVTQLTVGTVKTYTQILGPFNMADLANSQVIETNVPQGFTLSSYSFRAIKPTTTAGKAASFQSQVNGVNTTGGALSLASNTDTGTSGAAKAASAITAGNTGSANQTVGVVVSGVTAFVEGTGQLELTMVAA